MKALRKNKSFSLILATLAALILATATISQAEDSVMVVQGKIISVDPNSGQMAVVDDAGKTVVLNAGADFDLKALQKGDTVKVAYDKKGDIQSIDMQE